MAAIFIRIPDDVAERLENLAKLTGRPKSYYAIDAIRQYLDDAEDLHLAEHRWRDLQEGRSGTISLKEVLNRYAVKD